MTDPTKEELLKLCDRTIDKFCYGIDRDNERVLARALKSLLTEREGWVQQGYCLVNKDHVMYWGPGNISSEHMEHWPVLENLQYHERQKQWHVELLYSAAPKQEETG